MNVYLTLFCLAALLYLPLLIKRINKNRSCAVREKEFSANLLENIARAAEKAINHTSITGNLLMAGSVVICHVPVVVKADC